MAEHDPVEHLETVAAAAVQQARGARLRAVRMRTATTNARHAVEVSVERINRVLALIHRHRSARER